MRLPALALLLPTILSTILPAQAEASQPDQPPRWVTADDVRVRSGPSPEYRVIGILPRGAELSLRDKDQIDGYCYVKGEGNYGYVSCSYLSATPVKRSKAGEEGIDPAQRWTNGSSVIVREEPNSSALILSRLDLNAIVKLLQSANDGYCKVQLSDGANGYTACRYLSTTPTVLAHIRRNYLSDNTVSPDYDPERAFWLSPSWEALENYADYLMKKNSRDTEKGRWPRNEALEKMKAHLALGIKGKAPEPFVDWSRQKNKASQSFDLSGKIRKMAKNGGKVPESDWKKKSQMEATAYELQRAIGVGGPLLDSISADGGAERVIQLIRALEFDAVSPSYFHSEQEIDAPGVSAEEASGRFGIIYRQLTSARPAPKNDANGYFGAGLYDMLERSELLVKPIRKQTLFRSGRIVSEPSLVKSKETLWRDVDGPECYDWIAGFAFGDANAATWGQMAREERERNLNPAGSLFYFYTNKDLPRENASHTESTITLDEGATGFVSGGSHYYDFDGDGIQDFVIWEGKGKGPGHLDGPTTTNDNWYRLAMVNINGAWKILGTDSFGYGCGC